MFEEISMKKTIMGVIIFMSILSLLTGCGGLGEKGSNGKGSRAKDNESGISAFEYHYNGSIGANSYSYKVEEKDGKVMFTYEAMQHGEFGDMILECEPEILDRLYKVYKEQRLAEWDGYDKYNPQVLDGDGFSVNIKFKDGGSMSASGSNAFPVRYADFKSDMYEILKPLEEKVLEQNRAELIAKGINGNLTSIMVHFIQHGTSGKDEYDFFIIDDKYRENNCEITIKSYSERYFPKCERHCYLHVPYSEIDFTPVRQMIDDYEILKWYDYDKAAEDYNNEEWFQIAFGFDDDLCINACGTEHPEHYDEFRNAFIPWMIRVYDQYQDEKNID